MEIKLSLSNEQIEKLNSDAVKYYLGTKDNVNDIKDIEARINNLLNKINSLAESTNQLEHLECMGVDNWIGYSHYTSECENEDFDFEDCTEFY